MELVKPKKGTTMETIGRLLLTQAVGGIAEQSAEVFRRTGTLNPAHSCTFQPAIDRKLPELPCRALASRLSRSLTMELWLTVLVAWRFGTDCAALP